MASGPGMLPQSSDAWIRCVQTSQEYLVSTFQKQHAVAPALVKHSGLPSSCLFFFFFFFNFASLIAQLVKNPPALQETLVRFLGQEDPLEKG